MTSAPGFAPAAQQVTAAGPFTIKPGAPVSVNVPSTASQCPYAVVANASPYTLRVTAGGVQGLIAPYTSDSYHLPTLGAPITLSADPSTGAVAPGQGSAVYVTWYAQEPPGAYPAALGAGAAGYVSNGFQSGAVTTAGGGTSLGTFDTSGYPGMRCAMSNQGAHDVTVTLTWSTAAGGTTASRTLVLPAGGLAPQASFACPHFGDRLLIALNPIGGGPLNVYVDAVHHTGDVTAWSVTNGPVLALIDQSVAGGAGVSIDIPQLFAGRATFSAYSAGTSWVARLYYTVDDGVTFHALVRVTSTTVQDVTLPPYPLRVDFFNTSGVAANGLVTLTADEWRP